KSDLPKRIICSGRGVRIYKRICFRVPDRMFASGNKLRLAAAKRHDKDLVRLRLKRDPLSIARYGRICEISRTFVEPCLYLFRLTSERGHAINSLVAKRAADIDDLAPVRGPCREVSVESDPARGAALSRHHPNVAAHQSQHDGIAV